MGTATTVITILYRMCRISWRKTCIIVLLFGFLTCFLLVSFTSLSYFKMPDQKWYYKPAPCNMPESVLKDMQILVFKMHEALSELHIPHAVCYGTLWGTLRNGQLLPWDNNVDFCVKSADINKVEYENVKDLFMKNKLSISYNSGYGHYEVKYGSATGYVTVFLATFYGEMFRTGWLINLLWWFQSKPISFPSGLLEAPFPTATLYGKPVPVPHENIEILKYLYPDDWWLEMKPPNCV